MGFKLKKIVDLTNELDDDEAIEALDIVTDRAARIDKAPKDGIIHISEAADELKTAESEKGQFLGLSTGYTTLDAKMGGLEGGSVVLIGGETCLRGDAKIFNPITGKTKTVKELYDNNEESYVLSLDNDKMIATKADIPKRYYATDMITLTDGQQEITVTPMHQVWNGSSFVSIAQVATDEQILLPSISDDDLSRFQQDVQHCIGKDVNYSTGYRLLCHLYGQLLLVAQGIVQGVFPSLNDAPLQSYVPKYKGGQDNRPKRNHLYRGNDLYTYNDFSQNNTNLLGVFHNHFAKGIFSLTSRTRSLFDKSYSYYNRLGKVLYIRLLGLESKFYKTRLNCELDFSSYSKYTVWVVKRQTDDVYYDFNVPVYHNYYAGGLIHHNSNGKSMLALNIALNVAEQMNNVLYISLEMTRKQIWKRVMAITHKTAERLTEDLDFSIQESFNLEYLDIEPLVKKATEERGCEVVFIDYLQYLGRGMTEKEVAKMSQVVKRVALKYDVCIVVIVSLRKSGVGAANTRKWFDIEVEELMGTAALGYDADIVIITSRKNLDNEFDHDKFFVKVLKTRNTKLDYHDRIVELEWNKMKITEEFTAITPHLRQTYPQLNPLLDM